MAYRYPSSAQQTRPIRMANYIPRVNTHPTIRQSPRLEVMPTTDELVNLLTSITARTAGMDNMPTMHPAMPPPLPHYMATKEFTDMSKIGLTQEDMEHNRGPRQLTLMKIMAALQVSKYRAAYLPGPMSYRIFQNTTKYSPRYPSAPRGEPANLTVNMEPIRIIQSNPANRELITDNQGNTGIPIIPALDHANDCLCAAPTANNNIESLNPLRMCLPNELFINSYLEHKDLPTGHNMGLAMPNIPNPSNVYFSYISSIGTVLPTLIRRQPVAAVTRQELVQYRPQFASINMRRSKSLMHSVVAHLNEVDILQFTQNFNAVSPSREKTRFPHLLDLHKNLDTAAYGSEVTTLEDIIINEPLVNMYHGLQSCPFCTDIIDVEDSTCFIKHFHLNHEVLRVASFTCPGCLIPEAYNATTYLQHYKATHSQAAGLMLVLSETSGHARAQQAHTLYNYLFTTNMVAPPPLQPTEDHTFIGHLGGYTTKDPADMILAICEIQMALVPNPIIRAGGSRPRPPIDPEEERFTDNPAPWIFTTYEDRKTNSIKDPKINNLFYRLQNLITSNPAAERRLTQQLTNMVTTEDIPSTSTLDMEQCNSTTSHNNTY